MNELKKNQTAVEWLVEQLFLHEYEHVIKEALDMEKTQIIESRLDPLLLFKELRDKHGYFGGHDNGQIIDREINESEQYYNNKFK
jgi:hypothetical protein